MRPRIEIPSEALRAVATTAALRDQGYGAGRLRGNDLAAPFRGVRARADAGDHLAAARAYAPLLRPTGMAFSHATAATIWGLPLPRRVESEPIHVVTLDHEQPPQMRGVIGHHSSARISDVTVVDGLPVTGVETTWYHLAAVLDVPDLVAVGDAIVLQHRDGRRLASIEDLVAAAPRFHGQRGARTARAALPYVREGVRSRAESTMRWILRTGGVREFVPGYVVIDAQGRRVGELDGAWPDVAVGVEYEGDYHRTDPGQFRYDIERRERFEDAGWRVIRVTAADLFEHPAAFIARVAARIGS